MRPTISPALAADLLSATPSRLLAKLDADPALAERWTWTGTSITTDKNDVVTLTVPDQVTAVACTCLLSPRCLHVAAVVSLLSVINANATVDASVTALTTVAPSLPATPSPTAAHVFVLLSDLLATGAHSTGSLAQTELLRSIHTCRATGLHRLAAAQTRVLLLVRELRADRPEFALATLAAELRGALAVAHQLSLDASDPVLVGRARRDYAPIGQLRLRGLFSEAVVARSGHAGCITYLLAEDGAIFTRADVAAGDANRAAGAYDAPANLGDAVLPHRELGRAGLFVSDATASADGRLGAGQRVRAVRASEPARWDDPRVAACWEPALATQLAAIAAHDAAPDELRPAGWDLLFLSGTLAAHGGRVLLVPADHGALELSTAHDHRALHARDNLAILARSAGLAVLAIGRVGIGAPGRVDLLAIGPAAGETRFALPEAWHGRANLDYDRLSVPAGAAISASASTPAPLTIPDLLAPLRRRLERVALGGLATLPTHALAELDREAATLAACALGGGADALRTLGAIAHDATRALTGTRRAVDRPRFARAWLRAALYEDAARRRLAIASW